MNYNVGDTIRFTGQKQRFTVQACDERFVICTRPFNLKHTVLYTVIDVERRVRGTENLIFGMGAETRQQCQEMLERLQSGQTQVSYRNVVKLDIESRDVL